MEEFHVKLEKLTVGSCVDDYQRQLAWMVYTHLKDVNGWNELELKYSRTHTQIYLTGNDGKSSNLTVVPMDSDDKRSLTSLGDLFSLEENQAHRVVAAFCSSDGTIVYYELGDTLESPDVTT